MTDIYYYVELNTKEISINIDAVNCLKTKGIVDGIISYIHNSELKFPSSIFIERGCISKNIDNDKLILLKLKGHQCYVVEWECLSDILLKLLSNK